MTNPYLAPPPKPLKPDGTIDYKKMLCYPHLEGRCPHAKTPTNCKFGHHNPSTDDYKQYISNLQYQNRELRFGKGKGGKAPKLQAYTPGGKLKAKMPGAPAPAEAKPYELCVNYQKGSCQHGDQCRRVHQNEDGKCVKTAAPAAARNRARSASIRAYCATQRAAAKAKQ